MIQRSPAPVLLLLFLLALGFLYVRPTLADGWLPPVLEVISVNSEEVPGNGNSAYPAPVLSADGRHALFASAASNLIPGDQNLSYDAFVRDRTAGETLLVSRRSDGSPIPGPDYSISTPDAISADGNLYLFTYAGYSIFPTSSTYVHDVFLRDESAGTVELISKLPDGTPTGWSGLPDMSADGNLVVYVGGFGIYLYNRTTEQTTLVSTNAAGEPGNAFSSDVDIATDGSFIVFESAAGNLVPGDNTYSYDMFYKNLTTGEVRLLSRGMGGALANGNSFGPRLSANGRYVTFWSYASNLVPGDTNNTADTFLYDFVTDTIERVSVGNGGVQGNNYAGYEYSPVSNDGRYVAFTSGASNLVPNDTNNGADIFLRDRQSGQTAIVSVAPDGTPGNSISIGQDMTPDGQYILFNSLASNLVPNDTNGSWDYFMIDLQAPSPTAVQVSDLDSTPGDGLPVGTGIILVGVLLMVAVLHRKQAQRGNGHRR
jgi:hypothetical protein